MPGSETIRNPARRRAPEPPAREPAGPRLRRSVALVGMMGSGKTAVGKALAARLAVPFLDSDAAIEEAAQATIPEIFARDGEPFFRDREAEVIARLLAGPPAVLSTGGGAFMAERNRAAIARAGAALWLDADLDLLWDRVRQKDSRPLLRTPDPRGTLAQIYRQRVPVYQLAELRVRTEPGFSIEQTADRALAVLATRPDILETT
ncbi:shikimate kinase [Rubellimicrobium aerolatum]|uniref:Shikimate kinase n=1 Tax=Rubellimicrobium aerolatum TaxID=490979 RepID=A0ABW0S7Z0_9RHOB|nr:shikimate kinase [Rubellimicrobium aerolatum]MBP1804422.1 shikimate kinase [Rubellimicrobium aerolatum]